jgi:hypothetical protein
MIGSLEVWRVADRDGALAVNKVADEVATVEEAVAFARTQGPGEYHVTNFKGTTLRRVRVAAKPRLKLAAAN